MRRATSSFLPLFVATAGQLRLKSDSQKSDNQSIDEVSPRPATKRDMLPHREKNNYRTTWDYQTSKDVNPNYDKSTEKVQSNKKDVHTGFQSVDEKGDTWKETWPHEAKIPDKRTPQPKQNA